MTTKKCLVIWVGLGLALEGWSLLNRAPKDTISETVWGWAKHLLIVRFSVAFLFAHLFFQRDEGAKETAFWRFIKRHPVCATFLGLFAGYVCWQRAPELAHSTTEN
ncbi:MAG: hypothetical protein KY445_14625 [Armatimonadetes bacterium]|nr:hypothetical protein [Armatimonadota bacterium]